MDDDRADLWHRVFEHRERLVRLARARTPSADDAEDCVHEAMLRCVEFEGLDEERLGALLTTVTIRICADRYRARQYGDRLRHRLSAIPAVSAGPEDDVCDRAEAEWLAAKVNDLPPRQQALVRARAEGLSYAEVAARFRMSYEAVESQIARARKAIRSARATAFGILVPRWWVAASVSVGTAVLVTVAPSFHQGEIERRPRTVALPVEPERIAQPPVIPATPVVATRRTWTLRHTTNVTGGVTRTIVTTTITPTKHDPRERETPWVKAGGKSVVGPDAGYHEYTTEERIHHCIEYSVEISRDRVGCNYPP